MTLLRPPRTFYLLIILGTGIVLGFGYYLQFVKGIEPCPLCIFQRLAYIGVIAVSLPGLIHGPQGIGLRIYSGLIALVALTGGGIAAWQVRMIHLPPDQIPECGPGLDYMLEVFPLADVIKKAFTASGECAEVTWTFLGLSIPEWSLICFSFIAVASTVHMLRKKLIGVF
jgi:disulfide bond formation protein DsbB